MPAVLPATARQIWDELLAEGASPVAAAGIMGNMSQESGMDPESDHIDSNGLPSRGLVNWNAGSYPQAASLITGDPAADITAQIRFLASTGGITAAAGADPVAAATAFMDNYERCDPAYCNAPFRVSQALVAYQIGTSGAWGITTPGPAPPGAWPGYSGTTAVPADGTGGATLTSGGGFWNVLPFPLGEVPRIWSDIGGPVAGAEKMYQGIARLVSAVISGEIWLRFSEVILGVALGAAGLGLLALVLAAAHPDAVATIASAIPGEGAAVRAGRAAATAARGAGAGRRAVVGARAAARPAARRTGPSLASTGATARRAGRAAAGTTRRATEPRAGHPSPEARRAYTEGRRSYDADRRARARNDRLARAYGAPAGAPPDPDDEDYEAHRSSARQNRAYYHRTIGTPRRRPRDTADIRRRTP